MSKTIVIIGVTGIQGSSMANTFLRLPGWKVRGVTRQPSSPAAQAHAANGVDIVKGDLDDIQSLLSAFKDAAVIFSNTDFFGINIAEAAASPTTLKTLERFVLSSLSDARKWSHGKYTYTYHSDAKAEIIRTIQNRFPELAARMSTVQIGHYVRNWQSFPPMAPQKQPDGSFLMERTFSMDYKMPFVVTYADTGVFVKALVDLPPGKNLLGVSEHMTWPEWTKLWGDILGVKATYKQVSEDAHFSGVPDPVKKEFSETFAYIEEFGYTGGDPEVLTVEQFGIKSTLTSMEEYIKSEDWSSVL
ncbi:hypothetical protein MMC32_001664 [Xylographa parallela]|nr:hypothetical protein [Xylographa parallela]